MGQERQPERSRRAGHGVGGRPNSLGLDGKQLEALLTRVDGHSGAAPGKRRQFVRWPFRRTTIDLQINNPGGSTITCRVACRNLSCGGMSVLHSAFVYPGSPCIVHLTRTCGVRAPVSGVILRCVHLGGMVHEIGIKFDGRIAVNEFRDNDPTAGQFSLETVDPATLVGVVLHVEPSELERKLVQHYLSGSGLQLQPAQTPEQGAAAARAGCDIVLCGDQAPPGAAPVLEAVRSVLPAVPVVAVTTGSSPEAVERARPLRADALLLKPFDDMSLLRALGEFLLVRRAPGDPAPGAAPSHGDVATDTGALADQLQSAVRADDTAACYVACEQVASAARATGLASLERLAQRASAALTSTMSIDKSRQPVLDLIAGCARRPAA